MLTLVFSLKRMRNTYFWSCAAFGMGTYKIAAAHPLTVKTRAAVVRTSVFEKLTLDYTVTTPRGWDVTCGVLPRFASMFAGLCAQG